jgi:3-oxoacid CoA-transferase B subunit
MTSISPEQYVSVDVTGGAEEPAYPGRSAHVGLTSREMAVRVALEFREGMIVNLGTGLPTTCSEVVRRDLEIFFHSEQGVLGFGEVVHSLKEADPYLINASRQCVSPKPGMSFFDHSDSFALARGGRVDITVIGALQVSEHGDLANCRLKDRPSGLIGGGQDFAFCAKRVIVMMHARTRSGAPKLVTECDLPLTAPGAVDLIVSDVGVFEPGPSGFVLVELAPGISLEEARRCVDAELTVVDPLPTIPIASTDSRTSAPGERR